MKKAIPILLLAAALLGLAACNRSAGPAATPTPEPSATPTNDELAIMAASDTDAAASVQSHVPPASSTDLQIDSAAFDAASGCVGKTIFDLYAAIGQPRQTPVYTASETQQGAQEGVLVYNGFTVYTLRTDASEVVQGVELDVLDDDGDAQQPAQDGTQPVDAAEVPAAG